LEIQKGYHRKLNTISKRKGTKTNNDLQNITQKTKDRATRIPLKSGVNSGAPEVVWYSLLLPIDVTSVYLSRTDVIWCKARFLCSLDIGNSHVDFCHTMGI